MSIMRSSQFINKRGTFFSPTGSWTWSAETESLCATTGLRCPYLILNVLCPGRQGMPEGIKGTKMFQNNAKFHLPFIRSKLCFCRPSNKEWEASIATVEQKQLWKNSFLEDLEATATTATATHRLPMAVAITATPQKTMNHNNNSNSRLNNNNQHQVVGGLTPRDTTMPKTMPKIRVEISKQKRKRLHSTMNKNTQSISNDKQIDKKYLFFSYYLLYSTHVPSATPKKDFSIWSSSLHELIHYYYIVSKGYLTKQKVWNRLLFNSF